ncbi:MAG: hypothetical protein CSB44_09875 [Gammaproteobacteria bacterium]|nr:MAG: hypothetical protein CSB44_09875 [Gammaproteobacteria bacterium]
MELPAPGALEGRQRHQEAVEVPVDAGGVMAEGGSEIVDDGLRGLVGDDGVGGAVVALRLGDVVCAG